MTDKATQYRPVLKGFETIFEPLMTRSFAIPTQYRPVLKGFETFLQRLTVPSSGSTQYRPVLKGFETPCLALDGDCDTLYAVPPRFEGV